MLLSQRGGYHHGDRYLLDPLLVLHGLPLQVLAGLPGVPELRLVEVAAAPGRRQVLLQLPDGDLHLLQLGMVLLGSPAGEIRALGHTRWDRGLLPRGGFVFMSCTVRS